MHWHLFNLNVQLDNLFLFKCYNIFDACFFIKPFSSYTYFNKNICLVGWCMSVCRPCVRACVCVCVCMCCQTEQKMGTAVASQMADPNREDEQVTLLGEEGLRAGGQALKLGYDYTIFFSYVVLVLIAIICFVILSNAIMSSVGF